MLVTTIKLVGVLVLTGGVAGERMGWPGIEGQFGRALLEQQAADDEAEIAKLKVELRLPGPEARQKREGAVAALLGMKARKAHEALQEVLLDGQDADAVIPSVLTQLAGRLANTRDPVFGTADENGMRELRRSYIGPLIRLVGGTPPGGDAVRELARRALQQFDSGDRVPVFRELLRAGCPDRLAAAHAAGTCRDLGLVEMLGEYLVDPELRDAARGALRGLTFRDFVAKEDLVAWWQGLGPRTFVDLATDAATRGRRTLEQELENTILALVDAYVAHAEINWKKLSEQVLRAEPPGIGLRALQRLRGLLAANPKLTGAAADRQALRDELLQRLARDHAGANIDSYAVTLEVCAYLVGPVEDQREARAREDIELRLREALRSDHAVVRQAALGGMRRFPSEQNRSEVVRVAQAALAALGTDVDGANARVLGAALATLHAPDWTAFGAPGRDSWLNLLRDVIGRGDVPEDLRREALSVLKLRDPGTGKGRVPEGFEILVKLGNDDTQSPRMRELALIELQPFVTSDAQAQAYVELLAKALADRESGIRSRAANLIYELPGWNLPGWNQADANGGSKLEAWTRKLLDAAAVRLLEEPDATVHESVVYSMRRIAERAEVLRVIALMSQALEQIAVAQSDRAQPFRSKNIVQELRVLASLAECEPECWLRAAEAIAGVGDRIAARAILERHEEAKTLAQPGIAPALVDRAAQLTIRLAQMRTGPAGWGDRDLHAEVQSVLDAIARVQKAQQPNGQKSPELIEITLLQMAVLSDLDDHDQVLELAKTLPGNGGLTDDQRQRAILRVSRSHLEKQQPDEALAALTRLTGNGAVASEVLNLLEKICAQFVAIEQFPKVQEAGKLLVERTPDTSPNAAARLLMYAHALYKVDPTSNAERVRALLDEKRALFEAAPKELQKQWDDLRQRVQTGEGTRGEFEPAPAGAGPGSGPGQTARGL